MRAWSGLAPSLGPLSAASCESVHCCVHYTEYRGKLAGAVVRLSNHAGRPAHLGLPQVHRMGLSAPFFQRGWGDLGLVDFEEAARLIQQDWPPEHFQAEACWVLLSCGATCANAPTNAAQQWSHSSAGRAPTKPWCCSLSTRVPVQIP